MAALLRQGGRRIGGSVLQRTQAAVASPAVAEERRRLMPRRLYSTDEVMDDRFRWRKYRKKAVKSSPNLRNYYRCSAEGCGVKKGVERDPDDPRYVLTSYDGVHNHATPGSHSASREAVYWAPAVPTWTWSDLHAVATHSSESSY